MHMLQFTNFIAQQEDKMLSCMYKKYFGVSCPGCGMQRAFYLLIRGEFIESLKMFPALIPIMIMVGFLGAHIMFKFAKGHKILLYLFIFNAVLIVFNYIIKLLI